MSKRTKWSLGILLLAIVAVVGVTTAARRGKKGVEVRVEQVQHRDLVASGTASGQVQPRTKVDLSADITGRIVELAVKEGQMVSRGQFLLRIDPAQAQAAVQRAEAAVAAARAQAAQSKASYEQSRNNYQRTAEIRKAKPTLVAPMSGKVTRLNVEQGETAIMGTLNKDAATLLTISDMSVLETKVKVDETDVARISLGDSAIVEIDAFPDSSFVGRVVEISNSSVRNAAISAQGQSDQA